MKSISILLTSLFLLLLGSCSSTESIRGDQAEDGLNYFMPKKDIAVTLTIDEKLKRSVTVQVTPAYPDLSNRYVLRHGSNPLGKNTLNVAVTDKGLLTSSLSKTESGVSEAFKSLASIAGQFKMSGYNPEAAAAKKMCEKPGVYPQILEVDINTQSDFCGMKIFISQLGSIAFQGTSNTDAGTNYSGIFYRQNIPYKVTVVDDETIVETVVFSPSLSPIQFLPVSKSFFSGNDADFGFVDGVPTKYNQTTEGEIVALLKLPADILAAYFAAIGSIFDSFKTTDTKEAAALTESLKLELEKKKYDACISAIESKNETALKDLGCGS